MSIYNLNGDLKIEQLKAEQTVYAGDGAKCIVKGTTPTTVRVWSPARSSKGIDSETWYTFREFNMLFSLKDPLACNIESCEYWFCKSHNTCFFPNITRLRAEGEKIKAEALREAKKAVQVLTARPPKKKAQKTKTEVTLSYRDRTIKKYGMICYLCDCELTLGGNFTLDHVHPKVKGGKHALYNLRPCCQRCNWLKGGQIIDIDRFRETIKALDNPSSPSPHTHPASPSQSNVQSCPSLIH